MTQATGLAAILLGLALLLRPVPEETLPLYLGKMLLAVTTWGVIVWKFVSLHP